MSSSDETRIVGAFSPFAHTAFALLWTATLISNIGTWMHDVGAGWLMTTLDPTPAVVTLVQAATTLPVFLFALLAGTLADRFDKRRMLIIINLVMAVVVSALAILVWQERMTPILLILFTLAIGTGAAFMAPAWQAVVPGLIPRDKLKPAIALNSMGINISRAIGPAVAGVLIASVGLASPFALNAASYMVILAALILWKPSDLPSRKTHGSLLSEMRTGLRHVRHNPAMLATAVRALAFFLFASAYWSLLPLIARNANGGGSELYGILMALIGTGAVIGALLLPRLSRRFDADMTVRIGTVGTMAALLAMALSDAPFALMLAAFAGGLSWIAVLTSFNVSAQTALPNWVRARGLAVFLMVFFGSMSLGSVVWGQIATILSITAALIMASAGLLLGMVVTRKFTVGQGEGMDLDPASAWPKAPPLAEGQSSDRAAMVLVTYKIEPSDRDEFVALLQDFSKERMRDGAMRWDITQCVEEPEMWTEVFHLPSWAEHLEQHARATKSDIDLQDRIKKLDRHDGGPVVRHYLKPD
ncbi:MFS transporter [Sulfitobacter sp. F26169L]|uniref:MFS transporter n=1 Tax=Sulfitobacter sp. F26169L TaxID=2996015 RepID=UPI0022610344|nr:MFS transporter [Sulfitobacter sp. F26169L]MCX7567477.1 MFS transporter [Sulfitobacter sp. F26169L]